MRSVGIPVFSLALVAAVLSVPAQAGHDPLQPAVDNNILWGHTSNDPECCESWISAHREDARSTGSNPGGNPLQGQTWELPMAPSLTGPVRFDADATVTFVLYIGGSATYARVDVETRLESGGTVVAEAGEEEIMITPAGGGEYDRFEWTAPLQLAHLDPSEDLAWIVEAEGFAIAPPSGVGVPGTSVFMGMSETRGHSHIVLPVTSIGYLFDDAATDHETGFYLNVTETVPVTQNRTLTFTDAPGEVHVGIETNRTHGTLRFIGKDPAGQTLLERVVDGPGGEAENLTLEGAAGDWTFTLILDEFAGSYRINVDGIHHTTMPVGDDGEETERNGDDETEADDPARNVTGDAQGGEEGTIPAPAAVGVLIGLAAILGALRRNRHRPA